jgi:hypothetical protein
MADAHDDSAFRQGVFGRIFHLNLWGNTESASGEGSNLERTTAVRAALPGLFARHGIRSLLDAPCGDFFWMKEVPLDGIDYTGADIVPEIIAADSAAYADARRRFVLLDLVTDPLPRADLIFCRDCLGHLTYAETWRALENFRRSGATWLLTTTFVGPRTNRDIETGDWRPINLERLPYGFPPPVELVNEQCNEDAGIYADKSLGLWRLADLAPRILEAPLS